MNEQETTAARRQSATPAPRSPWHDVDFSGFLAFNPPKIVREDVRKMIYDGCYVDEIHPATRKFLREHKLSVTLEGPGR